MSSSSHRQIFRSTAITGGATAVSLAAGLIKVKMLAVIGGPVAVGLMGLIQSIMTTSATIAGCGLANSGVRAIAADAEIPAKVASLWRNLLFASMVLGLLAGAALTLGGKPLGQWLTGKPLSAQESVILSLGVMATLLFTTQSALLQGLRRIGDLALISIASAVVGAAVGLLPILLRWEHAIFWFVVASPLCSAALSFAAIRLKRVLPTPTGHSAVTMDELGPLFKLGLPVMAASIVTLGTQLLARGFIFSNLGADAAGHFQAAWSVSTTYIGFILSAMAADYFPRLSAMKDHPAESSRLVNQQVDMALTMSAPFVLGLIAFSPAAITLLYSRQFGPAFDVLRWQALGDIFKILCWPIGYILLASGKGRLFILAEIVWAVVFLGCLHLFLAEHGLNVAGIGFALAYVALLIYLLATGRLLVGFRLSRHNLLFGTLLVGLGGAIVGSSTMAHAFYFHAAAILSVSLYSVRRLDRLIDFRDLLRKRRQRT